MTAEPARALAPLALAPVAQPTLAPDPPSRVSSPAAPALLLSAQETAGRLGISRATLWRYDARGLIPAPVRIGAAVRWPAKALEDWIARGCPPRETKRR